MKTYETILAEVTGEHLLKVTLNRPEVGNARNTQMGLDLLDLRSGLTDDAGDIRCVILTGWSTPKTGARTCWRSTRSAGRCSRSGKGRSDEPALG